MTDAQLALRSQGGDHEAFTVLARRWEGRIQAFLRSLLDDSEDAHDLCQETLLRAFLNIRRLRKPENFKSWVFSIALNLSRDRLRRRGRTQEQELDEGHAALLVDEREDPHGEVQRLKLSAVLANALAAIPGEQRSAVLLREVGGFNSAEIAKISGIPAATVRSRIYYGLKGLRNHLTNQGMDLGALGLCIGSQP